MCHVLTSYHHDAKHEEDGESFKKGGDANLNGCVYLKSFKKGGLDENEKTSKKWK